jgi:hypothetical protein
VVDSRPDEEYFTARSKKSKKYKSRKEEEALHTPPAELIRLL